LCYWLLNVVNRRTDRNRIDRPLSGLFIKRRPYRGLSRDSNWVLSDHETGVKRSELLYSFNWHD
jgi:hypothetical protein